MSISLKVFFDDMELSREDAEFLTSRCSEAGLDEVIDLALLEPAMVPHVLGEDAGTLGPTLLTLAKTAERIAEGWARGENMMGRGAAGRGRTSLDNFVEGGPAAIRTPGRVPPDQLVVAASAGACPEEAGGKVPSVVRSARLLFAFTARTISRGVKRKPSPGPPRSLWRNWNPRGLPRRNSGSIPSS